MMATVTTPRLGRLDDPQFFFAAPAQREALARMAFALEHRLDFAVLTGIAGCGKSKLLSQFQRELRASPYVVFHINLNHTQPEELTLQFAALLGVEANDAQHNVWIPITRRLVELSYNQTPLVILCDDAHTASLPVLDWLARLWGILPVERWHVTLLFAMAADSLSTLPLLWQERLDLRIDAESWSLEDVRAFVLAIEDREAAPLPKFTDEALELLLEISGGVPRKVRRFTRVAMLAAIGEHSRIISESMLHEASSELCGIA